MRAATGPSARAQIFISHAGCDRDWAEWVGWELQNAGYRVELGLWDWEVGENIIVKIRDALQRCDLMIALFSEGYFDAERHTTVEWSALLHDRQASQPLILPLRVEMVTPPRILAALLCEDLFDVPEVEARRRLLNVVRGKRRPNSRPQFPGSGGDCRVQQPQDKPPRSLPDAQHGAAWVPNDVERAAAWELHVELITRVTAVPLQHGLLREALSSMYSLFGSFREILRRYGPDLAASTNDSDFNLGYSVVTMLNYGIRPVLSYWHPELEAWEDLRSAGASRLEHERRWHRADELRARLALTREQLSEYASLLANATGTRDLYAAPAEPYLLPPTGLK
ncbi:toll/interleukin-1 receptor domain-containing protein [Micromonospora sp. CPCC 205539]|uniref:toll/interleukin-1 receptor domain-containing protein n=1 Tax=Micromonospora sp. CPCC 205539 TaxID=3122408 RepID=UPI002FF39CA9